MLAQPGRGTTPLVRQSETLGASALRAVALPPATSWPADAYASTPRVSNRVSPIQWSLAAQPTLKIGIDQPGWYRITRDEVEKAGFAAGTVGAVDPNRLRLYARRRRAADAAHRQRQRLVARVLRHRR